MIHILIPIGLCYVIFFIGRHKSILQILFGVVALCLTVLMLLFAGKEDDIVSKIPFVNIESAGSETVDNTGSFYLETGQSAVLSSTYTVTDSSTNEEIYDWIQGATKSTYIYIQKGDDIIWNYNLGLANKAREVDIMQIYEDWKTNGTIPQDKIRYSFLCFYLDV